MNAQDLADQLVTIEYFNGVLCIWAYGAQARVDELNGISATKVELHNHFIPLFAAAHN